MAYIACAILEAKIGRLTQKRDEALKSKNYDRAWKLNMEIDKNINRLTSFCY